MEKISPETGATLKSAAQNEGNGGKELVSPPPFPRLQFPSSTQTNYTTWLLVRDAVGDDGKRPLAGGTVFWESPDVWVESTSGINQPVVGQPNQVFARVTNLGWQYATGVTVKFWWADPSLAITETTAHQIGIGWIPEIPSGWSIVVQCPKPWVPVVENEGHECLIAEAYIPHFDPLTAPMDPVTDRHVGQRNEKLLLLGAGKSFVTRIKAVNVTDLQQVLTFDVQPLHLDSIPPLLAARARQLPANLEPPSSVLPLTLNVSDAPGVFTPPSTLFASRQRSPAQQEVAGTAVDIAVPVQITHTAQFEPWESRMIEVTGQIPPSAKVGQSYAFRVVQRIGGMITGGYTVNVVVVSA